MKKGIALGRELPVEYGAKAVLSLEVERMNHTWADGAQDVTASQ